MAHPLIIAGACWIGANAGLVAWRAGVVYRWPVKRVALCAWAAWELAGAWRAPHLLGQAARYQAAYAAWLPTVPIYVVVLLLLALLAVWLLAAFLLARLCWRALRSLVRRLGASTPKA